MVGRKPGVRWALIVDTQGRLVPLDVYGADLPDPDAGQEVIEGDVGEHPRLELLWADQRDQGGFEDRAAELGLCIEIVRHPKGATGFTLLARRWVVGRTFAWLLTCRRLVRDDEALAESGNASISLAMSRRSLRRLAPPASSSNAL